MSMETISREALRVLRPGGGKDHPNNRSLQENFQVHGGGCFGSADRENKIGEAERRVQVKRCEQEHQEPAGDNSYHQ